METNGLMVEDCNTEDFSNSVWWLLVWNLMWGTYDTLLSAMVKITENNLKKNGYKISKWYENGGQNLNPINIGLKNI